MNMKNFLNLTGVKKMNCLTQVFFTTSLFFVVFAGCMPLYAQKFVIYDKSIPTEQTCSLKHSLSVTTRIFNGKTVSWSRNKPVIIPAGRHDFIVDYKWDNPINRTRETSRGIIVRYTFKAGHEYTMITEQDAFRRTVRVVFRDDTEIAEEKQRKQEEDKRKQEEYKAMLPSETTEPTKFEGTWKVPKDWGTQFSYISFKGNTYQYSPGFNDSDGEKGLFIIDGDILKLFRLFKGNSSGNWGPIPDYDYNYQNAVSEHRLVFEADGGFRLITIKGFAKSGTFYKEQTQ